MPNVSISVAERKIGLNYLIKLRKITKEQLDKNLVVEGKHNCNNVDLYNAINIILKSEGVEIDEW